MPSLRSLNLAHTAVTDLTPLRALPNLEEVTISTDMLPTMVMFPILFAAVGLIACVIGVASMLLKKKLSDNPHHELNMATWVSAGVCMLLGLGLTIAMFNGFSATDLANAGFRAGALSPWIAAAVGIVAGIAIGMIAEFYTSYDYNPTRVISRASVEGSAQQKRGR